jgi:hypothetical protein
MNMRFYDLGLEDDDDLGAAVDIRMPGDIKAEMDTVDASIKQFDTEIRASTLVVEFKSAWDGFLGEWKKFYGEHQAWSSRLWYAAYDKTLEYRKRLAEWRAAFVAAGGHPVSPGLPRPSVDQDSHIPWVIFGGALIGGGLLTYLITRHRHTYDIGDILS